MRIGDVFKVLEGKVNSLHRIIKLLIPTHSRPLQIAFFYEPTVINLSVRACLRELVGISLFSVNLYISSFSFSQFRSHPLQINIVDNILLFPLI
jgi:hypothetical protein